MTADKILKKYEDDNEYHFHEVDRKWIIAAMEEYAALRQPLVSGSLQDRLFELANDFAVAKQGDVAVKLHIIHNELQ